MFRFAIEKPIILLVGMLILCLFGLASLFRVPIQMIPDLDPRIISIDTRWPGATPQDVEKEIIIEQEEFLRGISGVRHMYSTASFGRAVIELEFPFGTDINEALILVNNALSQVSEYPENVDEPKITADSVSANSFMFLDISYLDDVDGHIDTELDWVEDNVKPRLERTPGVSSVRVNNGVSREIHIYLEPAKLAARGLSITDVRNAIRARNRDISAGDIEFGKRRYLVRTLGRFSDLEALNNLIIAERDGAFIRLKSVGHAVMSHEEIRSEARGDGVPILSLSVNRDPGSNVIEIKQAVIKSIHQANEELLNPRGMRLTLRAEDAKYVEQSITTVTQNLLIGALLAAGVLLLFLRSASATFIGALGIPICILAAFLGLLIAGRSINVISLAGIAFAIGMTLDNSIVALENISRHLNMGKDRIAAALDGIREVWPAILSSTLTTVMVFLPVIFLEMEAGQLYSDIAIAISASIFISMLVATTLIPAASSRFLSVATQTNGQNWGIIQRASKVGEAIAKGIKSLTSWLLNTPTRQIGTVFTTLLATLIVLFFAVPAAEYLPEGEEAKIFARMLAPPGYNTETMRNILSEMDSEFSAKIDMPGEQYLGNPGEIPPLLNHFSVVRPGFLLFITEPADPKHTPDLIDATRQRFESIPGMRSFVVRGSIFSDNRGGTRSINLELKGSNLETLYQSALQVLVRADELFAGGQVNADPAPPTLRMSQPMAIIIPDRERAAELGITQSELGYSLAAFSDGAFVDEFFLDDQKLDMYLFASQGQVNQPEDLEGLTIYSPEGEQVPVAVVAQVENRVGTSNISRVDGARTVTLQILPPRSIALETAVKMVKDEFLPQLRASNIIPPDIDASITGATSQLEQTRAALGGNFLMAVLIAYLLLVAVFSHWGFPLIIMTTVPIGIGGGIVGLGLFNIVGNNLDLIGLRPFYQPFDVITMLGFLILIGTVVNNPILIVERAVRNINERGMEIKAGIEEAISVRLRPVMMSTITTVCGLSPLVFIPGEGSELYRGLGAIVLSGLLFSSFVTLTILPVLIALVFEFKGRLAAGGGVR